MQELIDKLKFVEDELFKDATYYRGLIMGTIVDVRNALQQLLNEHDVRLSLPTKDWRSFRVKYYHECTMRDTVDGRKVRIDFAPHDLFEWFKKELTAGGNAS